MICSQGNNIFLSLHYFYSIYRQLLTLFIKKKKKKGQFCDVGKAFRLARTICHKLIWEWWNGGEISGSIIARTLYHISWGCCSHFIVNTLALMLGTFHAWMKTQTFYFTAGILGSPFQNAAFPFHWIFQYYTRMSKGLSVEGERISAMPSLLPCFPCVLNSFSAVYLFPEKIVSLSPSLTWDMFPHAWAPSLGRDTPIGLWVTNIREQTTLRDCEHQVNQ